MWNQEETPGRKLLVRVLDVKRIALLRSHYGPWVLKVGRGVEAVLDHDYVVHDTAGPVCMVRERLLAVEGMVKIEADPSMFPEAIRLEKAVADAGQ